MKRLSIAIAAIGLLFSVGAHAVRPCELIGICIDVLPRDDTPAPRPPAPHPAQTYPAPYPAPYPASYPAPYPAPPRAATMCYTPYGACPMREIIPAGSSCTCSSAMGIAGGVAN